MSNERLYTPTTQFAHKVDIQCRFSDYDIFGHINNNSFMAFFDLGKSEFFNDSLGRACTPADLGAVIVNINVDFLQPANTGDALRVLTAVDRLGDRSFRLYQRIVDRNNESNVKAQAITTLAGFDPVARTSAPLPCALVDVLSRFCPNDTAR